MSRLTRLIDRSREDGGFALPVVLGLAVILLILSAVAASATTSIEQKTQSESDWTAAYYAATAGLSDYQSRLASISNYNLYGNSNAQFSNPGLTMPAATDPLWNPAFQIGATNSPVTTWAQVPCRTTCSTSTKPAYFRYEVNTKDFSTRGIIHVRATGMVGQQTRSVIADFRRNGLFNFVYYTNYEIQDPTISGDPPACATYQWSNPARPSGCSLVQFGPYDTLNGDIFSNDQFYICGATFKGRVQSAAPLAPVNYTPYSTSGCGTPPPNFNPLYPPQNTASISLPPSNATLSTEARADTYTGASAGCMYTGPTSITLNADGTMTVVSPLTRVTQPSFTAGIPSQSPPTCGVVGTAPGQLGSVTGANFTVPADNLIYVQSVPTSTSDPNYTPITSTSGWSSPTLNNTTYSCTTQTGYTSTGAAQSITGWSLVKNGGPGGNASIQYPTANEDYVPTPTGSSAYNCAAGDAYVSGNLKGHVTIATDRNIYVTGNIDYASTYPTGSSYNLLGLVANVALVIWNPMNFQGCTRSGCSITNVLTDTDRDLTAAALAVKGTVMVQNYNVGSPRGTLNLTGSIEQNFRGTVATGYGSTIYTGYKKNYVYDANLRYNAPPKYLAPQNATFAVSQIASVPRAFKADGSVGP